MILGCVSGRSEQFLNLFFMAEKMYITREPYKHDENFKVPVNFKKVEEMTFDELKRAYNTRLVEKNEAHPESAFQRFWDEEMVLITNEIKHRKNKFKNCH